MMTKMLKILSFALAVIALSVKITSTQADEIQAVYLPILANQEKATDLAITQISDNRSDYAEGRVPKYEKFEISFQIENSTAQNFQFPYDPSPPPGIDLDNPNYQGITVNALFTPDNWQTTFSQPAFYYQEFLDQVRGNQEWYYPTGYYVWKVRFAPDRSGDWQYKLMAQDASGWAESQPQSFSVTGSAIPGFVRVSETDSRYFEFENGGYFSGLGYNLNYNQVDWVSPVINNQARFQTLSENGIHLMRIWLSQWGIYGSAWNPWYSPDPAKHAQYIPVTGLAIGQSYLDNEVSLKLQWGSDWFSSCTFIGAWKARPAVKPNTDYRVWVRYKIVELAGPRDSSHPYGLAAKTGNWLWNTEYCHDADTGQVAAATYPGGNWTSYPDPFDSSWRILEGQLHTQNENFLPYFYLVLENVTAGSVYVDYVGIEEVQSGSQPGPNVVSKPSMAQHLYFEQRNSYAFDKLLDLVAANEIYLRPVILEKNEWISNQIGPNGEFTDESNDNFYGNWRQETKGRWLQKAWWRYLQARWGYSVNIHSWELLNEGDPNNSRHYAQADEFAIFMKCEVFGIPVENQDGSECVYDHPNAHMVSTSFWHSFPVWNFWGSPQYPNIDYADVHAYNSTGWLGDPRHEADAAAYHLDFGRDVRYQMDFQSNINETKPIIRGEAGIDYLNQQTEQSGLQLDHNGVWLHNYLWASLDGNALIEEYWWTENINTQPGPDGNPGLHEIFRTFSEFIADIPLNNGSYQEAAAVASDPKILVFGQKDGSRNRAHLWIKNISHTWGNVVDGVSGTSGLSGTVTIGGFTPNIALTVEWYEFTSQGHFSIRYSTVTANSSGAVVLSLPAAVQITDVAVKIEG